MDVIPGIFGEKEFAMMSDDMICTLGLLLDDKVSLVLLNYMENPEADPAIVEHINRLIGDKIAKCTFHLKVIESGVIDTVRSLSFQNLAYGDVDYMLLKSSYHFWKRIRVS